MVGGRRPSRSESRTSSFRAASRAVDLVLEQAHVAAGERAPQVNHDGDVVQHVALGGLGRYSTEIVTTAEAIEPSWLREIWICGIDPAPIVERCAERAFRRSCITA